MADGGACEQQRYDKVIVAIHGIGSQRRGDTIRSVADRFGAHGDRSLPVMPLGHFHVGSVGEVHVSRLETDDPELKDVGFAEVFWADIPRGVAAQNDTLEETKAWGRSVISRARSEYLNRVSGAVADERPKDDATPSLPQLDAGDFELGTGVIEEIVETVAVLENLLALSDRAGVFKLEIGQLLRDYIGDVQLVADFQIYRQRIVYRFHDAMNQIVSRLGKDAKTKVYVVAHSEGTVVSFIALLEALTRSTVSNPDRPTQTIDTDWIELVRGFMTIGSPIDKHIVLWPKLWNDLDATDKPSRVPNGAIRWRNYFDYGDPIGFRLETARELLRDRGFTAFEFEVQEHDHGFSRYWLPGKAHTDYWRDEGVFDHFIDEVVLEKPKVARPKSYRTIGLVSTALPYLFVVLLHVLAVFALSKVAAGDLTSLTKELARQVGVLSVLLIGVTFAARLPRLVKRRRPLWWIIALAGFVASALPTLRWLPHDAAVELAEWVPLCPPVPAEAAAFGRRVAVALAGLVAFIPWLLPRRPRIARRTLIGTGALVLGYVVVQLAWDPRIAAWPAVLGGAAFLYLWWLAILLFDLAFVWHRYIRFSVAVSTLRRCYKHGAAPPVVDETKPGESPELESEDRAPKRAPR